MAKGRWLIYNPTKRQWWTSHGKLNADGSPNYWTRDRKLAARFDNFTRAEDGLCYNETAVRERPNRRS